MRKIKINNSNCNDYSDGKFELVIIIKSDVIYFKTQNTKSGKIHDNGFCVSGVNIEHDLILTADGYIELI